MKHHSLRRWARVAAVSFVALWIMLQWRLHGSLVEKDEAAAPLDYHHLRTAVNKPSKPVPNHAAAVALPHPHGAIIRDDKPAHPPTSLTRPHVQSSAAYRIDSNDLWEQPTDPPLPMWMKDYFRWHKEVVQQSLSSSTKVPYLLLTCPEKSKKCGGTVDRLSPLVFLIYIASRTHRLFLIHWGRPAALEEFLLPPAHGVDWRFDEEHHKADASILATSLESLLEATQDDTRLAVRCRFQAPDHGASFYNQHIATGEPTMAEITRTVWDLFFTPTPAVARRIQGFLSQHQLVPGHYLGTHIRALYAVKDQDPFVVQYWAHNAINCTTRLAHPDDGMAIFVASDASAATKLAQRYGTQNGWKVAYHAPDVKDKEPLHLDKALHWQGRPPSDYYDAFVDLYLLGLARCVTYGVGGYGKFAAWLTGQFSCAVQHHNATAMNECELARPPVGGGQEGSAAAVIEANIFRPPMGSETTERRYLTVNGINHAESSTISTQERTPSIPDFPDTKRQPPLENLWEGSTMLPQWMRDYFVWHRQQRKLISLRNWREFRYLVVTCTTMSDKCGGTSDRLRPIPYFIRVAFETKRILFIYWNKPRTLETFLLPPVGGMDWRTPPWLVKLLRKKSIKSAQNLPLVAAGNDVLLQAQIQAHDHGSHYYDNSTSTLDGEAPLAFRRNYHDCWYSVFTPVPTVALEVERQLLESGLVPGHFGIAHVRALYGIETQGRNPTEIEQWTKTSLNCLSQITSGPYYVASDSDVAKRAAVAYGLERNVRIVARTVPPVHMDIAQENQDLASLEEIFIDLFLLSLGRCLSFNTGGFAKWAQLLSGHSFTCNIRYWTKGVDKRSSHVSCEWNQTALIGEVDALAGRLQTPLFLPPMREDESSALTKI